MVKIFSFRKAITEPGTTAGKYLSFPGVHGKQPSRRQENTRAPE
jgi:hypothetical protein